MSHDHDDLQMDFLRALVDEKMPVSVFLINGVKLHGIIDAFNDQVIMLKNSVSQMVYKHAISTIVPVKSMKMQAII